MGKKWSSVGTEPQLRFVAHNVTGSSCRVRHICPQYHWHTKRGVSSFHRSLLLRFIRFRILNVLSATVLRSPTHRDFPNWCRSERSGAVRANNSALWAPPEQTRNQGRDGHRGRSVWAADSWRALRTPLIEFCAAVAGSSSGWYWRQPWGRNKPCPKVRKNSTSGLWCLCVDVKELVTIAYRFGFFRRTMRIWSLDSQTLQTKRYNPSSSGRI